MLLVFALGFWPSFEKPAAPMDEGALLVYPELVLHGYVPYRDFETFYGPANPYVIGAVFSIFGPGIAVERAVGLFYRLVILLALFGLARRYSTSIALGVVVIAGAVLLMTQLAAYAWLGGVACALCALWSLAKAEGRARALVGGLLAGAALLYRPDLALAEALAIAPLWCSMSRRARVRFCAGGVVALFPLAIFAIIAGPAELLNNLFLIPVVYSNPGRRLPILAAAPLNLHLVLAHAFAAGVNLTAGISALRTTRSFPARLFLAVALLAAALSPQALQRLDGLHLIFVCFLSLGLLPLSIVLLFGKFEATRARIFINPIVATVFVTALLGAIAPKIILNLAGAFATAIDPSVGSAIFVEQNGRSFPVASQAAAAVLGKLCDKLDRLAKPGDRLFVGPADLRRTNHCDTFIYHLFPLLQPSSYFLEMNPFSANRPGSRLTADIATADWLVLDMASDALQEANRSTGAGSDAPNDEVRTNFHLVWQYGPFVVLQRNVRSVLRDHASPD